MSRVHEHPNVVYSAGSQVIIERAGDRETPGVGSVATVISSPRDRSGAYRVRGTDGSIARLGHDDLRLLRESQQVEDQTSVDLSAHVILESVVGSRAYGLETKDSDTDTKGAFLPPAAAHWSLGGVPEQIEDESRQATFWELAKFLKLALRANPTALEVLYSPVVLRTSAVGDELIDGRQRFLSRLLYQTMNGYALSQFKRIEADIRNQGQVKWKHAMHLLRLLHSGAEAVRTGTFQLQVDSDLRETLLEIKRGEWTWERVDRWRRELHTKFDAALSGSPLTERADEAWANDVLIRARRSMVENGAQRQSRCHRKGG